MLLEPCRLGCGTSSGGRTGSSRFDSDDPVRRTGSSATASSGGLDSGSSMIGGGRGSGDFGSGMKHSLDRGGMHGRCLGSVSVSRSNKDSGRVGGSGRRSGSGSSDMSSGGLHCCCMCGGGMRRGSMRHGGCLLYDVSCWLVHVTSLNP